MNPLSSQSLDLQDSKNYPQTKVPTSLNFIKNYAKKIFLHYAVNYVKYQVFDPNLAPPPSRPIFKDAHSYAVFSALRVPVSQPISYCAKKILGCNQNTPVRNDMAELVAFAAASTTTALLAQGIGYDIEPKAIVYQQVHGLLLLLKFGVIFGVINTSYGLGMKAYQSCYENFSKKFKSIENETSREIAATISSTAIVGGAALTSSLTLGYSLGYSTADIQNMAISLIPTRNLFWIS